jgi:uncharacterized protein
VIVSNASPLHYLVLTGHTSVLPVLYGEVAIPAAVRDELLQPETPQPVREWMKQPPEWLEVHADPVPPVSGMLRDVGEAQAIALALALPAEALPVEATAQR